MLSVRNLAKHFIIHSRGSVVIPGFAGVSFDVPAGSLIAITGPSGTGKSSLLKCVYRTYIPSAGEIIYTAKDGSRVNLAAAEDWDILSLRRGEISCVSQFLRVMPRVSALQTLIEPLTSRGAGREEALDRAACLLSRAGIGEALWDMYPATFSGGEKQRLNILHAIITKPRLLLLDEPTASLDKGFKDRIMEMILDLKTEGTAMIGVFHDRDTLLALSDLRYDLVRGAYCDPADQDPADRNPKEAEKKANR
ncbi:MAG: ATP-binding cassette domain-containing protein [Treponema sp.]|jgi:alpha-D-ribose 1-methylphosphonate 5-triphosphate synthase subunit PhnL|nr:ATP-binding cassette domain-containing protein [Treponema sp.]